MPTQKWSPRPAVVALGWIFAVFALSWLILTNDPAGRLFAGVAVAGLIAAALYGSFVRPRLSADADGLTIRGVTGFQRWPWSAVKVKVVRTRRLGRDVPVLELETYNPEHGERLFVLTRLDLGAEPDDVAEALEVLRAFHP